MSGRVHMEIMAMSATTFQIQRFRIASKLYKRRNWKITKSFDFQRLKNIFDLLLEG